MIRSESIVIGERARFEEYGGECSQILPKEGVYFRRNLERR